MLGWVKAGLVLSLVMVKVAGAMETNSCTQLMGNLALSRDPQALNEWARIQKEKAAHFLWRNLNPPGTTPGTVVASLSRANPDYWYHWVRDAAISNEPVLTFYLSSQNPAHKADSYRRLMDLAWLSMFQQSSNAIGGLGEPKFHVDGTPYRGPWGRPQNDSQALRATLFTRFAQGLLNEGKDAAVREMLYNSSTTSLIKRDLEDTARVWKEKCFDLWEEINGQHFFTLMVQRKALKDGASLARRLGDHGAADYYEQQVREMEGWIKDHWNPEKGYIDATRWRVDGIDHKHSGLDSAVILAAIKAGDGDHFFGVTDERVLATAHRLRQSFQQIYAINNRGQFGTLIGRYPEDRYDGYGTSGNPPGNPWPLLTVTFAELHYKLANEIRNREEFTITGVSLPFFQTIFPGDSRIHAGKVIRRGDELHAYVQARLRHEGDSYFLRAKYHANGDFSQHEQINRETGFMQGAETLTWNYSAELTALFERER